MTDFLQKARQARSAIATLSNHKKSVVLNQIANSLEKYSDYILIKINGIIIKNLKLNH